MGVLLVDAAFATTFGLIAPQEFPTGVTPHGHHGPIHPGHVHAGLLSFDTGWQALSLLRWGETGSFLTDGDVGALRDGGVVSVLATLALGEPP